MTYFVLFGISIFVFVLFIIGLICLGFVRYQRRTTLLQTQFLVPGQVKKVAIIGAGPSGLSALKECLEAGFQVTCFDKADAVGGAWVYSDDPLGHSRIHKSTYLNSSKQSSCFSDFPIPPEFPTFMHHSHIQKYLNDYSDHFNLKKFIKFGTNVTYVDHLDPGWRVFYEPSKDSSFSPEKATQNDSQEAMEDFDAIIIANGHHSTCNWPSVEGEEAFKGYIIHSHSYKEQLTSDYDFTSKKILIVGNGDSAVDICTELSRVSEEIHMSINSPAYIIPKCLFGLSLDHIFWYRFLLLFVSLKRLNSIKQWLIPKIARITGAPATRGCLHPPGKQRNVKPRCTTSPDFWDRFSCGVIKIHPSISKFNDSGVFFHDGSFLEVDAVIYCSGYKIDLPFLDSNLVPIDDAGDISLFKNVWNPSGPHTLAVVGLIEPVGSVIPTAELQSRWIAQTWLGSSGLPSYESMFEEVRIDMYKSRQRGQSKYTVHIDQVSYMEEIASQIGVVPSLLKNWTLVKQLLFMPLLPPSYRLNGPGSKPDVANSMLRTIWEELHPSENN